MCVPAGCAPVCVRESECAGCVCERESECAGCVCERECVCLSVCVCVCVCVCVESDEEGAERSVLGFTVLKAVCKLYFVDLVVFVLRAPGSR